MSDMTDGGAAFPVTPPLDGSGVGSAGDYPYPESGMTLRDYIATHALAPSVALILEGLKAGSELDPEKVVSHSAKAAYEFADAMIAARGER